MKAWLLILLVILFKPAGSQNLSSVFLDSLCITIDDKKIAESNTSVLKFVPNNIDNSIKMFDDGIYKLKLRFSSAHGKNYSYLALSGLSFFKHDSEIYLPNIAPSIIYDEYCSNTMHESSVHRNWGTINPAQPTKVEVKVHYRLVHLAPVDTFGYRYNYREGLWTGKEQGVEKIIVNYKNDRKDGIAKAIYSDSSSFIVTFNNNTAKNYGRGHFENMKPLKLSYILPNIVTHSCNTEKNTWHRSFYFTDGKETHDISHLDELRILFQEKGSMHDSIDYEVQGRFVTAINDTLILDARDINIHNYYKKNDDPQHDYYRELPDSFAKIPFKSILYISNKRKKFFLKPSTENDKVWKINYNDYD